MTSNGVPRSKSDKGDNVVYSKVEKDEKDYSKGEKSEKEDENKRNSEEDQELEELYTRMPVTDETRCGFGCVAGPRLQPLANKKMFIALYGVTGCFLSSTYAYFNGTITTIEKRFKIPSKTTGVISIGNDITQLLASVLISYYGGKGHRPRWIAGGLYCVAAYCFVTALPHFIYGPGEDALALTVEYGNVSSGHGDAANRSSNHLCLPNDGPECDKEESSLAPQAYLFVAQLISGIGGTVYFSLGFSYMDDNIKKSKSPVIISFSYFIRTLGPPIGYALVSACLKLYIAPDLTPVITNKDPRWLGAWWLGWIVQGTCVVVMASFFSLLPKTLPRAAARKELFRQKSKDSKRKEPESPSLKDMLKSLKRIISNRIYTYSHLSSIFYVFGYLPYWIYLPKYIEIQYRQSASASSFATGAVGLVCSALGILVSGVVIQKFQPRARLMAGWNLIIGLMALGGVISYAFLGCSEVDKQFTMIQNESANASSCAESCKCEFAKYSPVCAADGTATFISACHAGCTRDLRANNGTKIFTNCSCVEPSTYGIFLNDSNFSGLLTSTYPGIGSEHYPAGGVALSGPCAVNCLYQFYCFLGIVCFLKFFGATGRLTNFLVSVRCVDEEDKALSIGIGMTAMSLFALIPSPIIFGYVMDWACLVWGKTCSSSGNCWLYDAEQLRYKLNFTSAAFMTVGTLFDFGVWFAAKNLNVYEEPSPDSVDGDSDGDSRGDSHGDSHSDDGARNVSSSFDTRASDDMATNCSVEASEGRALPLRGSFETGASDDSKVNCFKLSDDRIAARSH